MNLFLQNLHIVALLLDITTKSSMQGVIQSAIVLLLRNYLGAPIAVFWFEEDILVRRKKRGEKRYRGSTCSRKD